MFHIIASLIWVLLAWRYGDWRNWRKYHATILYLIAADLLHNFLLADQPLWQYRPAVPFLNHTLVNLFVMLVIYPCTMLVYLPRYPKGLKQIPYVLFWTSLWAVVEWILDSVHLLAYYRGWTIWHSIGFDLLIFLLMPLHQKHPLRAYWITAAVTVLIMWGFGLTPGHMR